MAGRKSVYYQSEVSRGEYSRSGVFLLQYFLLVTIIMRKKQPLTLMSRAPQRHYSGLNTPLGHHADRGPIGPGQYNSLGDYCGHHTASTVFLILVPLIKVKVLFV